MKKLLAVLAASAFAGGTALAAELTEVDTDANGMVSWEEAQAAMPDISEDAFKAADADGDGSLNAEEFATLQS